MAHGRCVLLPSLLVCNVQCVEFARSVLQREDVAGSRVLEVGSYDYNGSVRRIAEALEPSTYVGVDIVPGPGVDEIVRIEDLEARFGPDSFDVVICTETLEHVLDWRAAIWNLKAVVRPGGVLIVTTRSRGFYFHGYPGDYWRYELEDMRVIFADMTLERLESDDPNSPGVFLRARRTGDLLTSDDFGGLALYSIIRRRRILRASGADRGAAAAMAKGKNAARRVAPDRIKQLARKAIGTFAH